MAVLRTEERRTFIDAVVTKAAEMRVPIAVAIVTAEGHLLSLERMDSAGFLTSEIAQAKAFTVAAFRSMSPRFQDGLLIQQWFKERNPQMLVNAAVFTGGKVVVSGGSAPIFKGDELVGAYGISGGTSDQDEVIARHARESVGWSHLSATDDTPEDVKAHINEIYDDVGLGDRSL